MERKQWTREGVLNFALDMADVAETDSIEGMIEWASNQEQDIQTIIKEGRDAQANAIARARFQVARQRGEVEVAASIAIPENTETDRTGLSLLEADMIIEKKGPLFMDAARLQTARTEADRIALAEAIIELEELDQEKDG